eukprot:m.150822 g.150822  ORF g.150822 m.150822 type:complete len:1306 (+) comp13286_c0_seq1:80-3997(+)
MGIHEDAGRRGGVASYNHNLAQSHFYPQQQPYDNATSSYEEEIDEAMNQVREEMMRAIHCRQVQGEEEKEQLRRTSLPNYHPLDPVLKNVQEELVHRVNAQFVDEESSAEQQRQVNFNYFLNTVLRQLASKHSREAANKAEHQEQLRRCLSAAVDNMHNSTLHAEALKEFKNAKFHAQQQFYQPMSPTTSTRSIPSQSAIPDWNKQQDTATTNETAAASQTSGNVFKHGVTYPHAPSALKKLQREFIVCLRNKMAAEKRREEEETAAWQRVFDNVCCELEEQQMDKVRREYFNHRQQHMETHRLKKQMLNELVDAVVEKEIREEMLAEAEEMCVDEAHYNVMEELSRKANAAIADTLMDKEQKDRIMEEKEEEEEQQQHPQEAEQRKGEEKGRHIMKKRPRALTDAKERLQYELICEHERKQARRMEDEVMEQIRQEDLVSGVMCELERVTGYRRTRASVMFEQEQQIARGKVHEVCNELRHQVAQRQADKAMDEEKMQREIREKMFAVCEDIRRNRAQVWAQKVAENELQERISFEAHKEALILLHRQLHAHFADLAVMQEQEEQSKEYAEHQHRLASFFSSTFKSKRLHSKCDSVGDIVDMWMDGTQCCEYTEKEHICDHMSQVHEQLLSTISSREARAAFFEEQQKRVNFERLQQCANEVCKRVVAKQISEQCETERARRVHQDKVFDLLVELERLGKYKQAIAMEEGERLRRMTEDGFVGRVCGELVRGAMARKSAKMEEGERMRRMQMHHMARTMCDLVRHFSVKRAKWCEHEAQMEAILDTQSGARQGLFNVHMFSFAARVYEDKFGIPRSVYDELQSKVDVYHSGVVPPHETKPQHEAVMKELNLFFKELEDERMLQVERHTVDAHRAHTASVEQIRYFGARRRAAEVYDEELTRACQSRYLHLVLEDLVRVVNAQTADRAMEAERQACVQQEVFEGSVLPQLLSVMNRKEARIAFGKEQTRAKVAFVNIDVVEAMTCIQEELMHKAWGRIVDKMMEEERQERIAKDTMDGVLEQLEHVCHERQADQLMLAEQQTRVAHDNMDSVLSQLSMLAVGHAMDEVEDEEQERRVHVEDVVDLISSLHSCIDSVHCHVMEEMECSRQMMEDARGFYDSESFAELSDEEQERRSHYLSMQELVQEQAVAKVRRQTSRDVCDLVLAEAIHHHMFSEVLSDVARRGAAAAADEMMEEERTRQVHEDNFAAVLEDVVRVVNQKRAIEMEAMALLEHTPTQKNAPIYDLDAAKKVGEQRRKGYECVRELVEKVAMAPAYDDVERKQQLNHEITFHSTIASINTSINHI